MLRKIGLLSFVVTLGIIVFATEVPIDWRPKTGHVHFERISAYALLGVSSALAFPKRILLGLAVLLCIAFGLEYSQTFVASRHGRWPDAIEKSFGAIVGVALVGLVLQALRRSDLSTPGSETKRDKR